MDAEKDRNEVPEFLPIRRESIEEEHAATLTTPRMPEEGPTLSDVPSTEPASREVVSAAPDATLAPSAEGGADTATAEPTDSAVFVSPLPIVHATAIGPTPAGPTEPSHHYQIPLPDDLGAGETEPGDRISQILGPPSVPHLRPRMPAKSSDRERLVPSIMVTVMLGHSRDLFEQAVEAAIQRATQKFHKIVKQEIDLFAFEQRAARRAADYRLRGPNPQ